MTKHALQRLKERYNLDLTWQDLDLIVKGIQNNFAYQSAIKNNKEIYWVLYGHCPIKLVYASNKIITVLPFEIDEYNNLQPLNNILSIKEVNRIEQIKKVIMDNKFKLRHKNESLRHNLNIIISLNEKHSLRIYTKTDRYILIGRKLKELNVIEYAIFDISRLKNKLKSLYKFAIAENVKDKIQIYKNYLKKLEKYGN